MEWNLMEDPETSALQSGEERDRWRGLVTRIPKSREGKDGVEDPGASVLQSGEE